MRILLLNYEYPPLGGGAAVAAKELAERLVRRGIRVDVVTSYGNPEPTGRQRPAVQQSELQAGLTVYRVPTHRKSVHQAGYRGALDYLVAAAPLVRRLLRAVHYDVTHFFFSLPTGALIALVKPRRIPAVVSLRGSDVPGYDGSIQSLQVLHTVLTPITRWIWRRADRVVAVCEALGRLARDTDPKLRYAVIRNGVDLDLFHPVVGKGDVNGAPVRCIATARLIERKGIADLLWAWSLLERDRFRLEIVGTGPLEPAYRELVRRLGLEREVEFLGVLSRSQLADRYRMADVFTLVPHSEAFGNVFAEALASGLPIVASEVGGICDLVTNGINGILVPPRDPATCARALASLASDPDRRRQIGLRNRADAERCLSWDSVTDEYVRLYEHLVSGNRIESAA